MTELLPAVRAIYFRGVVQSRRNVAESCQKDGDGVSNEDPGGIDNDRDKRQTGSTGPPWQVDADTPRDQGKHAGRLAQPTLRWQMQYLQGSIEWPFIGAIQIAPDRRRR